MANRPILAIRTKMFTYTIEHGNYVLRNSSGLFLKSHEAISLAISEDNGMAILHKHGSLETTEKWLKLLKEKHESKALEYNRISPSNELENIIYNIKIYTGHFPVCEINKLINNIDYTKIFLEKLTSGSLLPESALQRPLFTKKYE
jgi:hypothetical protein